MEQARLSGAGTLVDKLSACTPQTDYKVTGYKVYFSWNQIILGIYIPKLQGGPSPGEPGLG